MDSITSTNLQSLYSVALWLAIITIFYNIGEGLLSMWLGYEDEAVTLFGFGIDSFVEVISGIGILHMILRLKRNPDATKDRFEKTALRVTGIAFFILVAGLIASSGLILYTGHIPVTTFWGLIISTISILAMTALIYAKTVVGKKLTSEAILADASCTRVCLYMSVILLLASGLYELTHLPYIDAAGTLGLAYFSFKEGRECFEKARSDKYCTC